MGTQTCVAGVFEVCDCEGGIDGGALDVGVDAPLFDAPLLDRGATDVAPLDASQSDAPVSISCISDLDFCQRDLAVDCVESLAFVTDCGLYGNVCTVVQRQAACVTEGECPTLDTCDGNTAVVCCPEDGRFELSTGEELPCAPRAVLRAACQGESRCEAGDCVP